MRGATLRARLTLWSTAALGALLVVLGATAWVLLDRGLRANVDQSLVSVARAVAASSEQGRPGTPLEQALEGLLGPALAERFFQLLDPYGRPDPRLPPRSRLVMPLSEAATRNAAEGRETFETLPLPGLDGPVRLLTWPVIDRGRLVNLVQVGMPLGGVEATGRRFLLTLLALAPLALAGVAAGGWLLAGRALAPVDDMAAAARRIGDAQDLSLRVEAPARAGELGRLAAVLNDMLARLERSFSAARQFSADAAHELRTPLTILGGEIDVALQRAQAPEEYGRVLASCREEVTRMTALVEDLLFLARADAGAVARPLEPVDLTAVLDDVTPALHALAERHGAHLTLQRPADLRIRGSAPMLFRIILNLVDNAVTHGGSAVQVALRTTSDAALLEVRDDGPGIPADAQAHLFDRFYRTDAARSGGGTGLGLALVRSMVQVHGGEVTADSAPGAGTLFRVRLPRPSEMSGL